LISYQMGYLKAHYPIEFMTALLNLTTSDSKKQDYIELCKEMSIDILGPDINRCDMEFRIEQERIHFGLKVLPHYLCCNHYDEDYFETDEMREENSNEADINKLLQDLLIEREANGLYKNIEDLLTRIGSFTDQNKSIMTELVECGVFDTFEGSRKYKQMKIEEFAQKR